MNTKTLVASAVAAAIGLAAAGGALAQDEKKKNEKCFGIAKAGKNDCQTATNSCAGSSKSDGQGDAWIFVPNGVCERLVNGSLAPKA